MSASIRVRGFRVGGRTRKEPVEDDVALDAPIGLFLNETKIATIFAMPSDLEDLALGHLLGEGVIESTDVVERISVSDSDITVHTRPGVELDVDSYRETRLILSSCGTLEDYINILKEISAPRVASTYKVKLDDMVEMVKLFSSGKYAPRSRLSVHSAALLEGDELRVYREDVSRHALIDKVIGGGARGETEFGRSVLITTGRLSGDMILKVSRVGIPIAISIRGPLYSGIYAGLKTGVTVISIPRGRGLTVYTYPERVVI